MKLEYTRAHNLRKWGDERPRISRRFVVNFTVDRTYPVAIDDDRVKNDEITISYSTNNRYGKYLSINFGDY